MKQIKINDTLIDVISVYGANRDMLGAIRDSLAITMTTDYDTASATFTDGITYSLIDTKEVESYVYVKDDDGNVTQVPQTTTQKHEYDKSIYCLSGDIVDHRDGTITVYMGVKTDQELAEERATEAEKLLYDALFGTE